jgi:LCP family protein required for cell wall assembly
VQISPSAIERGPQPGAGRGGRDDGRRDLPVGYQRPGRRRARLPTLLLLVAIFGVAGAAGLLFSAHQQVAKIDQIAGLHFSAGNGKVENYLLVGSDSREGADPSDPDFAAIGGETDVTGNRSDTVMVLRRDLNGGPAALLSLPRDLCVDLPDCTRPRRINAAYQDGPQALIDTVINTLGIPIHHYVEINFQGFKQLVNAIGGVRVCNFTPVRDTHTGLFIAQPGCFLLDGFQGLAYARSRHFETYDVNSDTWHEDPSSDFGRIKRQQDFINTVLQGAVAKVKANPLKAGDVLVSITGALHIDSGLDVIAAASAMRDAVGDGLQKYTPPVVGKTVKGNALLVPAAGFDAYIDYFRGGSTAPATSGP